MPPQSASPLDPAAIRAVLLDIEGTTTPVEFVTGVLFPFARARLRSFLEAHAEEPEIRAQIEALRREHAADLLAGPGFTPAVPRAPSRGASAPEGNRLPNWAPDQPVESAAAFALWLMDRDRKSTALKELQGRIWAAGYRSGELRGQVYPDVPPALERWKRQGRRIAIFSSGSVQAQKLLFGHSDAGDLTRYLDAYFDTTTGPKQDPQSYRAIAAALAAPPQAILFLSDSVAELNAARAAGTNTALSMRPGSKPGSAVDHPVIHTFEGILP